MAKPDVFISYARSPGETAWASAFARALEEQGLTVWLDTHERQAGGRGQRKMERALRGSKTLVAVIDPQQINQPVINFELGAAFGMGKRVLPILPAGDETPLPYNLRTRRFVVRGSPNDTAQLIAEALGQTPAEPDKASAG